MPQEYKSLHGNIALNRILTQIYNEYYLRLCSIAYRYVHDYEDAKDAVSNEFTGVLVYSEKYSHFDYAEMVKIIHTSVSRCAIKIF